MKMQFIAAVLTIGIPVVSFAADATSLQEKLKVCATCHGETGAKPIDDNPKLAGQHYDYLLRALTDYKSGVRRNPVMAGMVGNLTKQDLADLAAYFARQPSVLQTKY